MFSIVALSQTLMYLHLLGDQSNHVLISTKGCFYTLRCISTAKYLQIVIVFLSLQRPKGVREYYKVFLYHKTWFLVLLEILLYTLLIFFNLFQKNDYMRGFIPYRKVLRRFSWSIGVYAPSGACVPTSVDRHYKVSLFSQRPQRC